MPPANAARFRIALTPPQAVISSSGLLWLPAVDDGRTALVLAHGAGSDITNVVLCAVGRGLAERGHPVLTFNFAYTEGGRKRPDSPDRLQSAFRDAIAAARTHLGDRPLVLGGRSMGARVATLLAAAGETSAGLVLLGYPLHPVGRRESLRTEHWPRLSGPMLFVQGDRDRLCDLRVFAAERGKLAAAHVVLHVLAGADHAFAVRKVDGRLPGDVLAEVTNGVAGWLAGLPAAAVADPPARAVAR